MTTEQLVRKIKKFFRENGETAIAEMNVPELENGNGKVHRVNILCADNNEIGVASSDYFFPLDELTWKELSKIKKFLFA